MKTQRPNRIRQYRRQADLTQEQLALQIGIHPAHLSDLERGRFKPNVTTATALAQALGVPVEQLFVPTTSGEPPDNSQPSEAPTRPPELLASTTGDRNGVKGGLAK